METGATGGSAGFSTAPEAGSIATGMDTSPAPDALQSLFENSPDAIWLFDTDRWVFVDCNQAAVALLRAADKARVQKEKAKPPASIHELQTLTGAYDVSKNKQAEVFCNEINNFLKNDELLFKRLNEISKKLI